MKLHKNNSPCRAKRAPFTRPQPIFDWLSKVSLGVSKKLNLKNPLIYLGVLLLATFVLFLVTLFSPPFFSGGRSLSIEEYLYLVCPLSLIGIFYTTFVCSKIFSEFGFRYWSPIFPIIFIFLASFTSLLGMIGLRPFHSLLTLNQIVILLLLCISLALYFIYLRFLFPMRYIESKNHTLSSMSKVTSFG